MELEKNKRAIPTRQLSSAEVETLSRSQIVTGSEKHHDPRCANGRRIQHLPCGQHRFVVRVIDTMLAQHGR